MRQNMVRLIDHHWDSIIFFPRSKSFLRTPFGMGIGVTQGDPASPMIFNIIFDTVARATL